MLVIGDELMCVLAKELYGAEIVDFSDFERVRAAKRKLFFIISSQS